MCVCFSGETVFQLRVRTTFSSLKFLMSLEIKTATAAAASTKHGELVPDQRPRRGSESRSGAPRFSLYISCARQHTAAVRVVLLWLCVSLRSERRASGSPLSSPTICGTFYCVLCHVESLWWRRICLHLFPVCGPSQRLCSGRRRCSYLRVVRASVCTHFLTTQRCFCLCAGFVFCGSCVSL